MARITKSESGYLTVRLSANDTYAWAHKPGAAWPCSQLSGRRVRAKFDPRGDLVAVVIDGGRGEQDVDGNELNACILDFVRAKFPDHPAIR